MTARTRSRPRSLPVATALLALAYALAVPSAEAVTATTTATQLRSVEREGRCRVGPGEWELKVQSRLRGRLRVEYRVDRIAPRMRWQMFLSADGRRIASVTRFSGASGNIKVTRLTRNHPGRDRIRASAVNPRTGSTCAARLRF